MKTKDMENKFDMLKEKARSICFKFSAQEKYLSQKKEQKKVNFDNENLDVSSAEPKKHQGDGLKFSLSHNNIKCKWANLYGKNYFLR